MNVDMDPNMPSMPGMDYPDPALSDIEPFEESAGIIPNPLDVLKSHMDGMVKKMGTFEKTIYSLKDKLARNEKHIKGFRLNIKLSINHL